MLPINLVYEMGRLSNKCLIIVTHGKPGNRCKLFNEGLSSHGQWEEKFIECELSFQSQFINIVRVIFLIEAACS